MRRKRGKLVRMRAEGKSRQLGDLFSSTLGKFRMSVQTRSHRRAADCKIVESVEHLLEAPDVAL